MKPLPGPSFTKTVAKSPPAPFQRGVKRVLLQERYADEGKNRQPQHGEPDPPEGLHEGRDDPVVPPVGEVPELVEVVADAANLLGRVGLVAEALPEPGLEDVLVNGRSDRDADCAAKTPSKICNPY